MQQFIYRRPQWLVLSVFLVVLFGSFIFSQGIAFANTKAPTTPQILSIPNVTCTTSDNQTIYANYSSIVGNILFRVGYEDTPNKLGYGYCHVLAGHPDALAVIAYVLQYGHVTAATSTSVTIEGIWPGNWKNYRIYIVTSNNRMNDGQMRGIVSAYATT